MTLPPPPPPPPPPPHVLEEREEERKKKSFLSEGAPMAKQTHCPQKKMGDAATFSSYRIIFFFLSLVPLALFIEKCIALISICKKKLTLLCICFARGDWYKRHNFAENILLFLFSWIKKKLWENYREIDL